MHRWFDVLSMCCDEIKGPCSWDIGRLGFGLVVGIACWEGMFWLLLLQGILNVKVVIIGKFPRSSAEIQDSLGICLIFIWKIILLVSYMSGSSWLCLVEPF